jgi:ParB family chromosome partitioning protein
MAFAVTDDGAQQLAVWNEVKDGYVHASHVKRLLTDEKIAATSKLVRFVGLEAYQAAGGAITRDLFAEGDAGVWLEDRALVERLAQAKLDTAAHDLKQAEGWKWVQAAIDLPWDLIQKCQTVYPQAQEPTPEQAAELERLQKGLEIYEAIDADGGLSPEDEEKVAELEERHAEIEDALRSYAAEDLARAGAFVSIDHSGELSIRRGLVRPEDRVAKSAVGDGTSCASGYSAKLAEDLGAFRLQIAQAHLAQDFDCAFDLALFTMAHGVLGVGYLSDKPLDASYTATLPHGFAERFGTEVAQLPPDLDLAWLDLPPEEGFQAMCAMPPEVKRRLFAHCVALTLRGGLGNVGGDDLHEEVGRRLGVDVAAHWRPTAENFFKRLKKDRALAIAEEVLGETWARNHKDEKKAVLAETLEANFSGSRSPGVAAEQALVAARWLPDGMAYPRGETPDAGEPVPGEPAPDDLPEAFRLPAAE